MILLTNPEHACDRIQRKRIAAEINRRGGCGCCQHRDKKSESWDRAYCKETSRSFPLCTKTAGVSFELDENSLGERE